MRNIIITIALVSSICVTQSSFAYDYGSIADNTWVRLSPTGGPPPAGLQAFSGMAYDKSGKLILFGGGHNDYLKNDTWIFDIANDNWVLPYTPDPNPLNLDASFFPSQYPGSINYSGSLRPLARHTYSNITMMYDTNGNNPVMFITGKFGPGAGTPGLPWTVGNDTWGYSPTSNTWSYLANHSSGGEGASIFVPHNTTNGGLVYNFNKNGSYPRIHTYDPVNNVWANVATTGLVAGIPHTDQGVAYDSREHAIYLFAGATNISGSEKETNALWRLDLTTLNWQKMNSANSPPAGRGHGLAYDSINHVLIAATANYNVNGPIGTYIFEIANNRWVNIGARNLPNIKGVGLMYGRLRYDSTRNVAFLVTLPNDSYSVDVWAYRYRNGNPDTSPPSLPTGLTSSADSEYQVSLSWGGSTDADSGVSQYRIYRSPGANIGANPDYLGYSSHLNTDPQSFVDSVGLNPATQYTYLVTAVNFSGYENAGTTTTVTTLSDQLPPTLKSINSNFDPNLVYLTFSENIDATTGNNIANYSISNGINISAAATNNNRVTLTTSTLTEGATYTVTINNLTDTANPANTIGANTTDNFTYVTALTVSPPSNSSYTWNTLSNGGSVYVDRTFTYQNIGNKYLGHQILRTANDDKQANINSIFSSNMNVTVFLGHFRDGINLLPSWIKDNGWVQTNDTWNTNDRTLYVYVKDFPVGNISLQTNGATSDSSSMYTVLVAPQASIGYSVKQASGGNSNPIPTPLPSKNNNLNTLSGGAFGIYDLLFLIGLGLSLVLSRTKQT